MEFYPPPLGVLHHAMDAKGYHIFRGQHYDLNIIGVRTNDGANTFNDWLTFSYLEGGIWVYMPFPGTTDPGTYYREHPINVSGTGLIVPGQYRGMWEIGLHQGKYEAFVQRGPVRVYRDANRDNVLDTEGQPIEEGLFGANLHRANAEQVSTQVDKWSAMCQVLADPRHLEFALRIAKLGNSKTFTYTLLEERDFTG